MERAILRNRPTLFALASTVIHLTGASLFWYTAVYNYLSVNVPDDVLPFYSSHGRQFKFLTYWNELVQASYMTCAFFIDFCYWLNLAQGSTLEKWTKTKDFYQTAIVFPVASYVSLAFWFLFYTDRAMVLPEVLEKYYPAWMNQVEHTCVFVFQILEVLTSPRDYQRHSKQLKSLFHFQLTYTIWMVILFLITGQWVYPILNVLNVPMKILFISSSMGFSSILYFIGYWINFVLWGATRKSKDE